MLGERTAEDIKTAIGSAFPMPDEPNAEIRGRDLVSGLPKTIVVSAEEIRKAIEEPVNAIVDSVKTTLDKCPPELAGDEIDQAIISYVKKEYSLMLGERTAEEIKIAIGSAFPMPEDDQAEIRGRDLVTGLPKTIVVSGEEIRRAIEEPVNAIVDAVKNTLDKCPPELSGDIMDRGIVLTGGGALLKGLDERLRHETGMPILIADNPLHSVAIGSGRCVEDFDALQQVLVSERKRH